MKKVFALFALILTFLMLEGCAASATELPIHVTSAPTESMATVPPQASPVTEIQAVPAPETITREEAIAIALEHAGFATDQVNRLECEFDVDDRVKEYDVDFHKDKYEYSFDIHAETGEILFWEKEIDD